MKLNLKQTLALDFLEDKVTTELLYGGAAGGGKSILGCYFLTKNALRYPESRWVMGRANMKTLKETTYVSFLKVARMQGLVPNKHFYLTAAQHKEFPNSIIFPSTDSVIIMRDLDFYPSDPDFDELGSLEITGGFIDEGNQIKAKAKNILKSRMRHNIQRYDTVPKLLITCNPAKNWTYQEFYKPHRENTLELHKKFIQALVDDNPDIDPSYKANLLTLDKNSKERLLYGNWEYDDDPAALISYDKILACFTNNFEHLKGSGYITADLARFGSDKIVQGNWNGWRVKIKHWKKESLKITGGMIEHDRLTYGVTIDNVICDDDGLGGGLVDFMGYKGFVNNSSPLVNPETGLPENYNNLKSQCYFRLAKRINEGGLYIDCDDADIKQMIIEELEQVKQYNMDKDGKKQVLPKDKVKEILGRSPDFADMLMMREWFELEQKMLYAVI